MARPLSVLDEANLHRLRSSNAERLAALNGQGVTIEGLDNVYIVALLEALLGPERVGHVQLQQARELDGRLTEVEAKVRQARITAPLTPRPS